MESIMLTQNKVLWLHCTINGIAAWVISGIFKCHFWGIVAFYWQKRLHDSFFFFWCYCFLSKSTAHRKKVLGFWNCEIATEYYLRIIDMIWNSCYIVYVPAVILFILANLLPSLLAASLELFFFPFYTSVNALPMWENWGPKFIAVYYSLV